MNEHRKKQVREAVARYRKNHPEKKKSAPREYQREYMRKWYKTAPKEKILLTYCRQRKKHECTLTEDWIRERLDNGICEVTGIPFSEGSFKASVDRIDNSKGYTPENCRLVVWIYNSARRDFSDEDFTCMVKAFYNKNIHLAP